MVAIRGPFSALGGVLLAAMLFLGLAQLVSVPFDVPQLTIATPVLFTPQRIEEPVQTTRDPPPEREPPIQQPDAPRIGTGGGGVELVRYIPPKIEPVQRGGGLALSGVDGDVIPRIRVNPDYPPGAITKGTEGWVQVRFTVTAIGTVRDAVIVASEPDTIFDDAALKAIARWRYNPRVENGEAVERVGLQTMIRFELEN